MSPNYKTNLYSIDSQCFNSHSPYRFGFSGKENDNEVKGGGSQQDYGMRIYDTRLGRFLSVDPLLKEYPWNSTYAFAENDVIRSIDLDGLEKVIINKNYNTFKSTYVAFSEGENRVPSDADIKAIAKNQFNYINSEIAKKPYKMKLVKEGSQFKAYDGEEDYYIKFDIDIIVIDNLSSLLKTKKSLGNEYGGVVLFGSNATFQGKPFSLGEKDAAMWEDNDFDDVILLRDGKSLSGFFQHEVGHDLGLTHFGSVYGGNFFDSVGKDGSIYGANGQRYNSIGFMAPKGGVPLNTQIVNLMRGSLPQEIIKGPDGKE